MPPAKKLVAFSFPKGLCLGSEMLGWHVDTTTTKEHNMIIALAVFAGFALTLGGLSVICCLGNARASAPHPPNCVCKPNTYASPERVAARAAKYAQVQAQIAKRDGQR